MAKRHRDALLIQEGACNPCGIAHSLVEACREVIAERGDQRNDPAVRLIIHQLAYLVGVPTDETMTDYAAWTDACKAAPAH